MANPSAVAQMTTWCNVRLTATGDPCDNILISIMKARRLKHLLEGTVAFNYNIIIVF